MPGSPGRGRGPRALYHQSTIGKVVYVRANDISVMSHRDQVTIDDLAELIPRFDVVQHLVGHVRQVLCAERRGEGCAEGEGGIRRGTGKILVAQIGRGPCFATTMAFLRLFVRPGAIRVHIGFGAGCFRSGGIEPPLAKRTGVPPSGARIRFDGVPGGPRTL